jgi:hypothetical protein
MAATLTNEIRPQAGPQETFLSSRADIAIYGGAAGGGKTFALLIECLRHVGNSGFGAVVFRRTSKDIRNEGALWDNSKDLYSLLGAKPREQYLDWKFPSGATVTFNGLQYDSDVYDWQGAQICLLAFDELTHFTERQFFYLLSRNRSTCGVRPYVRATLNPDPDSWVYDLLGPWVNPEHPKYGAQSGELRFFIRQDGEIVWVPEGTEYAKSITFVAASIFDNAVLLEKDPGYLSNLKALPPDEQARLLLGLWTALEAKGALWKRAWIDRDRVRPDRVPRLKRVVIGLDPNASDNDEGDEAGIVAVGEGEDGHYYTLEDASGYYTPDGWARTAIGLFHKWKAARIIAEKNQGGAMVGTTIHQIEKVPVTLVHAKQSKEVRAQPVAQAAESGKDHHVGTFRALEGQLTRWVPGMGMASPDRLDAKVYAILDLMGLIGWTEDESMLDFLKNR